VRSEPVRAAGAVRLPHGGYKVRCVAAAAAPRRRAQGGVPAAGRVMARRVGGILGDRDTGEQGGADCCRRAARPPQPPALRAGRSQSLPRGSRAFLLNVCTVWRYLPVKSVCVVRSVWPRDKQVSRFMALPAPRRRRATTAPHAGSPEHARRPCGTPEGGSGAAVECSVFHCYPCLHAWAVSSSIAGKCVRLHAQSCK